MTKATWMIYGVGESGAAIAAEAIRRGHRPLLAGRSAGTLEPVAQRLGLEWLALDLQDAEALGRAVAAVDLVLLAAGPFLATSAPMLDACLAGATHYVDIAGELGVYRHAYAQDTAAQERGIVLLPGAGFGVIPTDCLAAYVAAQLPGATELAVGSATYFNHRSAGALATTQAVLASGGFVRRDGALVPLPLGSGITRIPFPDTARTMMPGPLPDLEASYRTTGIPTIIAYTPVPGTEPAPVGSSYSWAQATDATGRTVQAWLETGEGYHVTAMGAILCVEKVLTARPIGALTPAAAFGADLILEIDGTTRHDTLPSNSEARVGFTTALGGARSS